MSCHATAKGEQGTSKMTFSKYRDFRDPDFFHKCTTVRQFWILLHIFITIQLIGIFLYTSTRCAHFPLLKVYIIYIMRQIKYLFFVFVTLESASFWNFLRPFFLVPLPSSGEAVPYASIPLGWPSTGASSQTSRRPNQSCTNAFLQNCILFFSACLHSFKQHLNFSIKIVAVSCLGFPHFPKTEEILFFLHLRFLSPALSPNEAQQKGPHRHSRWFPIYACKAFLPAAP